MMNSMFLCSYCPKTFVDKRQLKLHQRYHLKENFKCLACDKSFTSKQSFNTHSSLHKESIFSCGECFKTFNHPNTTKEGLLKHMKTHHKEDDLDSVQPNVEIKDYSSDNCDATFAKKRNLTTHMKSVHEGITYKCEKC